MPAINKGQEVVLDTLLVKQMSIVELVAATDFSDSYIRMTLKYLEAMGQVEKVDNRVPFVYRIPLNDPKVKLREMVTQYEIELLNKETQVGIAKAVQKIPKNQWVDISDDYEAVAMAIRNLDKQGKLVETLED